MIEGVGDFYAGLLHPLVVPAEALALVAAGLLLGTSGLAACRLGLPALAAGLAAGLALGRLLPPDLAPRRARCGGIHRNRTPAAAACSGGHRRARRRDRRDRRTARVVDLLPLLVASGASLLGGTALATVVVALALGRERHWQRVAARVAASWIAASAILYFGGLLVPPSR